MSLKRLTGLLFLACFAVVVAIGCAGADGINGTDGVDGADGADGADGMDGTDGTDFPGPVPAEYTAADGILGGAAYSKWWTTDAGGSGTQPTTTAEADFYRCKACHAWDGEGNAASYANRTGQSTLNPARPDVSLVNLRSTPANQTYEGLFDLVMHVGARDIDARDNTHPDYSLELTTDQAWNIVKFIREEWVAPNLLYDIEVSGPVMYVDRSVDPPVVVAPTVTYTNVGALGDEVAGQALFASTCGGCHGADGTAHDLEGRSLGQFVREKPNEAWFKAKFGEAGTGMTPGLVTAISDLQDLYAALANATNFPDLP
ncbi:MAG: c-type cytochrome [Gemmatimonadales bacterium]|jgi:cytochrome c553